MTLLLIILLAPFIVISVAAAFLRAKSYFWSSILLSLGLSSWAVIFFLIRRTGSFYGGADIGAGIVLLSSWYVTVPCAFIGLFLGSLIPLKASKIITAVLLCVWTGLSLSWNLSVTLKEETTEQQAIIDCETMPYHCAINENRLSDLPLLKSQGRDIESKDGRGDTALVHYLSNYNAVKALLELGADPDATGRDSKEAITLALGDGAPNYATAELLLTYGADINNGYSESGDDRQMTLLGHAISQKNSALVKFLIAHGANPDIKDGYGYTACDRARIYQLNDIEQLNAACRK
jgi:hypothetical protein